MQKRDDLITKGTKRRSGLTLKKVVFIVAHDTGNDGSTAKNNVDYYKRTANEMSASAHIFVDDIECVTCIPTTEKAWHVMYEKPKDNQLYGIDANDGAIGVELCYFTKDIERSKKAYQNYVQVIAELCFKHNIQVASNIVGHYTLDPQRKTDPLNAFKYIGITWTQFIQDVRKVKLKLMGK